MARKKLTRPEGPVGPIIADNLFRLGFGDRIVRGKDLSELIDKKWRGKRTMSRQRITNILNSVNVSDQTLQTIAEAIGVEPGELLRTDFEIKAVPKSKPKGGEG